VVDYATSAAGLSAAAARPRRIRAWTKNVISPPIARHEAKKSIGAIVLPVASLIQGTTFWAMKPPRLPTELIAASPAAADAPVRNVDGKLQSTGWPEKIPTAAAHKKANRNTLFST
jgi:hypothetical protein